MGWEKSTHLNNSGWKNYLAILAILLSHCLVSADGKEISLKVPAKGKPDVSLWEAAMQIPEEELLSILHKQFGLEQNAQSTIISLLSPTPGDYARVGSEIEWNMLQIVLNVIENAGAEGIAYMYYPLLRDLNYLLPVGGRLVVEYDSFSVEAVNSGMALISIGTGLSGEVVNPNDANFVYGQLYLWKHPTGSGGVTVYPITRENIQQIEEETGIRITIVPIVEGNTFNFAIEATSQPFGN